MFHACQVHTFGSHRLFIGSQARPTLILHLRILIWPKYEYNITLAWESLIKPSKVRIVV